MPNSSTYNPTDFLLITHLHDTGDPNIEARAQVRNHQYSYQTRTDSNLSVWEQLDAYFSHL